MRTIAVATVFFLGISAGAARAKKAQKPKSKPPSSFWCGTLNQNGHETASMCFGDLDQTGCEKVLGYFADQYHVDHSPCWQQSFAYSYRAHILGALGAKADDAAHYFPTQQSCEDARGKDMLPDPKCVKLGE
jgi:hypothetical protein